MTPILPNSLLDQILALQLLIAWAGEATCEPPRLGWWRTDLHDPEGGGDLLARLLPKTHAWASLEAIRQAALRCDAKARDGLSDPDKLRTLYFLGFDLDERLAERLAYHKRSGLPPEETLPFPMALKGPFASDQLADALHQGKVEYTVTPGGRQLKGPKPDAPALLVQHLASALLPLADKYPMPYYRLT